MKFYPVLPGQLYLSGSFKSNSQEAKLNALRAEGISTVICTLHRDDPDLRQQRGLEYIVMPVPDGKEVPELQYHAAVEIVLERLQVNRRVLVHCLAGRNRSGLICGLVIRQIRGVTGKKALTLLRIVRPTALVNPVFEAYLKGLPKP